MYWFKIIVSLVDFKFLMKFFIGFFVNECEGGYFMVIGFVFVVFFG